MPGKQMTPAPIDRPLSRAYLRQFTGWSTAYPPGISDPTSLRVMENAWITREGACAIRPGLRYLSYDVPPVQVIETEPPTVTTIEIPALIKGFNHYPGDGGIVGGSSALTSDDDDTSYIWHTQAYAGNGIGGYVTWGWQLLLSFPGTPIPGDLVSTELVIRSKGDDQRTVCEPWFTENAITDHGPMALATLRDMDNYSIPPDYGYIASGFWQDTRSEGSAWHTDVSPLPGPWDSDTSTQGTAEFVTKDMIELGRVEYNPGDGFYFQANYAADPGGVSVDGEELRISYVALRVTYSVPGAQTVTITPGVPSARPMVGTHEPFYLNDGSKAYLFAVREEDETVGFRVLANNDGDLLVRTLTEAGLEFELDGDMTWPAAVTYVKYLQIDNKIFALNNAGYPMKYFTVGTKKTAKELRSVTAPGWNVADKLTVVHPDAAWITDASAAAYRTNHALNPSFEINTYDWLYGSQVNAEVDPAQFHDGTKSLKLESNPLRTNLIKNPAVVAGMGTYGIDEWTYGYNANEVSNVGGVNIGAPAKSGGAGRRIYGDSSRFNVTAGDRLKIAYNLRAVSGNIDTGMGATGVKVRFYNTSGSQVGSDRDIDQYASINRKTTTNIPVPAGAVKMSVHPWAVVTNGNAARFTTSDWVVCDAAEATTSFYGDSGTNYFWTGTPGRSRSVYHPPQDLGLVTTSPVFPGDWTSSVYVRAGSTVRDVTVTTELFGGTPVVVASTPAPDVAGAWTRFSATATGGPGTTDSLTIISIAAVPRGEHHWIDSVLIENSPTADPYFDGNTTDTSTETYAWVGEPHKSKSQQVAYLVGGSVPPAETPTADTLISSTRDDNIYNFGFFYTFSTEIGESAASQVTIVKTQRGWSQWHWETANAAGEPSGTGTGDADLAADQLAAWMPPDVYAQAVAEGAIQWNLYMFTWSNQDPVPVTALRVNSRIIDESKPYSANSWIRATPMMADTGDETAQLPTRENRRNYTDPSRGGQGIVAADRMVMVYDPSAPAVIRWTSNNQGAYTDFTASRGGGYKTLTSGNLMIPASVKLWQNPQSVDTLTILCIGTDGYSTGYYMAPAQVASQSAAVNIMSFEETTATPGTTSPYGVEVMNNALYHPLDDQLMKSVASNYNINHSSVTDQIQNMWRLLTHKEYMISSQSDNRIYLLVYNPDGAPLEDGCRGNEVWVFDGQAKMGTWSRWLIQGVSLRKIEQAGHIGMSLIKPEGIYFIDETFSRDDYVDLTGESPVVSSRAIPWYIETNTQGANRAHDAWCHLQKVNLTVGNFQGILRYGVKGLDIHGKWRDMNKQTRDYNPATFLPFDLDDQLLVQRDLKEWFFYAGSVLDEDGNVQESSGQLDLVQYQYTPSTVNTGYEQGSVETFEYGRAGNPADSRTTDNGVPMPFVDTRRP